MKKLNNKGFTLIELLAVIVILAVVMGVATTSVLSAMNNSRKNSLVNSAMSAADSYRAKYAEYSMGGQDELMGLEGTSLTNLIAGDPVVLTGTAGALGVSENNYDLANSYVQFDTTNSTFIVCLTAKESGSYYVAAAKKSKAMSVKNNSGSITVDGMWACSDDTHSWD